MMDFTLYFVMAFGVVLFAAGLLFDRFVLKVRE
jgi:hypothetical protein